MFLYNAILKINNTHLLGKSFLVLVVHLSLPRDGPYLPSGVKMNFVIFFGCKLSIWCHDGNHTNKVQLISIVDFDYEDLSTKIQWLIDWVLLVYDALLELATFFFYFEVWWQYKTDDMVKILFYWEENTNLN